MGETDSYLDWERSMTLDAVDSKHPTLEKTKIGVSRNELKKFLNQWKKQNPTK
jgi:hypothetical protein